MDRASPWGKLQCIGKQVFQDLAQQTAVLKGFQIGSLFFKLNGVLVKIGDEDLID